MDLSQWCHPCPSGCYGGQGFWHGQATLPFLLPCRICVIAHFAHTLPLCMGLWQKLVSQEGVNHRGMSQWEAEGRCLSRTRFLREPKGLAAYAESLGDGLRVPEESWESHRT